MAQTDGAPSRITAQEIDGHLRFLSSDMLEGWAPATRGGQLALADIVYLFGLSLGNARTVPTWNADAEFKALREGMRSGQ
jgi:hypothetical protein